MILFVFNVFTNSSLGETARIFYTAVLKFRIERVDTFSGVACPRAALVFHVFMMRSSLILGHLVPDICNRQKSTTFLVSSVKEEQFTILRL